MTAVDADFAAAPDPVRVALRGAVLELTLNRPAQRNALSIELVAALTAAVQRAATDDAVRCVILTGAPPAFCAGLDLAEAAASAVRRRRTHSTRNLRELYDALAACPRPIIAAVAGPALAGGAALVASCDLAICGAAARLGYPGVRHGLIAPVVMPSLVRLVGPRRAAYLLLTGELLTGAQAVAWGLANEVVPDEDVLPRARRHASLLAGFSPTALAETKALLRACAGECAGGKFRRRTDELVLTDFARASLARFLEERGR